MASEATNINCIKKSLQVHKLGQNISVNVSLLYGINSLSPMILAQLLVLKVVS